jgi:hypothetical protein
MPAVQAVLVRGTNWTGEFLIHVDNAGLGTGGYRIPDGAAQSAPLPWSNMNQLVVVFSEPVVNLPESLAVGGEATGLITFHNLTTATRPDGSFVAIWTEGDGNPLPDDNITFTLPDTITNTAGVPLDGEWTNGADSYPSGNGTAGGSFHYRFVALPGDVNQDGFVNLADVADDVVHGFQRSNSGTFSALHDVNGSAIVNAFDAVLIRDRLGSQAASPPFASVQYGPRTGAVVETADPSTLRRALRARVSRPAQNDTSSGSSSNEPAATTNLRSLRASRGVSRHVAAVDQAFYESFGV